MWRSPSEQNRQSAQVDAVTLLERRLTQMVLLDMVIATEADRPTIRRLESDTPISIAADMGTLDRALEASGNATVMAAHPGTVSRALAAARLTGLLALKPVRELEPGHLRSASVSVVVPLCAGAAP